MNLIGCIFIIQISLKCRIVNFLGHSNYVEILKYVKQ